MTCCGDNPPSTFQTSMSARLACRFRTWPVKWSGSGFMASDPASDSDVGNRTSVVSNATMRATNAPAPWA